MCAANSSTTDLMVDCRVSGVTGGGEPGCFALCASTVFTIPTIFACRLAIPLFTAPDTCVESKSPAGMDCSAGMCGPSTAGGSTMGVAALKIEVFQKIEVYNMPTWDQRQIQYPKQIRTRTHTHADIPRCQYQLQPLYRHHTILEENVS